MNSLFDEYVLIIFEKLKLVQNTVYLSMDVSALPTTINYLFINMYYFLEFSNEMFRLE